MAPLCGDLGVREASIPSPQHQRQVKHPTEGKGNDQTCDDFDDSYHRGSDLVSESAHEVADYGPGIGVPDDHNYAQ